MTPSCSSIRSRSNIRRVLPSQVTVLDEEQAPAAALSSRLLRAISGSARLAPLQSMQGGDAGATTSQKDRPIPSGLALAPLLVQDRGEA